MRKYIGEEMLPEIMHEIEDCIKFDEAFKNDLITSLVDAWGSLPDGYTRCSFIESNGTQYIHTNIVPNQDTRVIVDFEVTEVTTPVPIFGARVDQKTNAFGVWVESNETKEESVHVCPQYGSVGYTEYHILMNPKQRLLIDMYNTGTNINGNISNWERSIFSTDSRLTILSMCSSNVPDPRRAVGKLRSCRVYENGMLSLFLVPVISPDGDAGMFDKIGNEFYGNAGEGIFVAG